MRFFVIPASVLTLLLGLSLWNAAAVDAAIEPWRGALAEASEASERGEWETSERTIRETRTAWEAKHPYFHLVTAHDELDRADALFAQAESYAGAREGAELRAALAELSAQLRVVSEMQRLTLKNVL